MRTEEEAARIQYERREIARREQEEYVKSGRKPDADRRDRDYIMWWQSNHYSGWA